MNRTNICKNIVQSIKDYITDQVRALLYQAVYGPCLSNLPFQTRQAYVLSRKRLKNKMF